jgi:hypothetical protein
MKKLDADQILRIANARYAAAVLQRSGVSAHDASYMAPELMPKIESEQVKAMLFALVGAIN